MEQKISLLAQVASRSSDQAEGAAQPVSILTLAAASYGSRPSDEATVPTGFDPQACALFESIVEGAYLVASADGVIDDEERKTFEKVVTTACGGAVPPARQDVRFSRPAPHALALGTGRVRRVRRVLHGLLLRWRQQGRPDRQWDASG